MAPRALMAPARRAARSDRVKARVDAHIEHPFRVIKRQFGYAKARDGGTANNITQVLTLFASPSPQMPRW